MAYDDEGPDETTLTKAAPRESAVASPAALPMSEIQLRIARERPRNEEQILNRIAKELAQNAGFADEGFYSIPYKDNRKGVINFVEGLSIRAAEHVWTRWGNCTVGARIADDRGNKIMVQGMFFDYESGLLHLADLEVSKQGKTRAGGTYPLDDAKLRLAVQSGESKVKRNAFLGGLPVWIKESYKNQCFDLVLAQPSAKDKSIAERIDAAKKHFTAKFGIDAADVEKFMGKISAAYPTLNDRDLLRYLMGTNNALKNDMIEIEFVFGEEKKSASMPQSKKKEVPTSGKEKSDGKETGDAING